MTAENRWDDVSARIAQYKAAIQVTIKMIGGVEVEFEEVDTEEFVEIHVREKGAPPLAQTLAAPGSVRARLGGETREAARQRVYHYLAQQTIVWGGENVKVQRKDGGVERNGSRLVRLWLEQNPLRRVAVTALAAALWRRGFRRERVSVVTAHGPIGTAT